MAPRSTGHETFVAALALDRSGGLAVTGSGPEVFVWDIRAGRLLHRLKGHAPGPRASGGLAVPPDDDVTANRIAMRRGKQPGIVRHARWHIRRGGGLTFAKLAECEYVLEVLGDLSLSVAYERLPGWCACSVTTCKPSLCATPTPLTCSRRTPSLGAVSALPATSR